MNWKPFLAAHREDLLTIGAITIVALVSFGGFNSRILSSDDWSYFVAKYVFGTLQPVNLSDRRPFILVLYSALASLFGLQFQYYYFFNFLILFFSALMVYAIVKRSFPAQAWIAGPVALAYLVYPVDYTREWLIMIYIRTWWLASLGVIWLLLEFAATGKLWSYALALAGIALPLGAYEGQFGVILLASALIASFSKGAPLRRRALILAGVAGVGIVFLLWRTYLQARLFAINDTYVEALQFGPAVLLERYLYGLYLFSIGWLTPLRAQLELVGFNAGLWLPVYFALCGAAIYWLSTRTAPGARVTGQQKKSDLKAYLTIFMTGSAFWMAGYIPIIALYRPMLGLVSSRVNSFAIPGAALMLVSGLAMLAALVMNSTRIKRLAVTAALLPFILAGIYVQQQVHRENRLAWEAQKKIWQGVFEAVPNLHDGKSIVIVIPGYRQLRPFQSYPFLSGWEIEAGAQVLYNNPKIGANYYYKDIQAAALLFTKNGFRPIPSDKAIPYKRLVFVYYQPESGSVTLVKDLEKTLGLPFAVNNYHPLENIIPVEASTGAFRRLVE